MTPKCKKTTFDELYSVLCELITYVTGRKCWRKMGMQVAPKGPYATVYLKEGPSAAQDVLEEVLVPNPSIGGYTMVQAPVGLTRLECKAEFFRNVAVMPALDAAIRFRQCLQVESRYFDLWRISGLSGEIRVVDFSEMFRSDVEGRAEVRFNLYAEIGAPPLTNDHMNYNIEEPGIRIHKDKFVPTEPPYAVVPMPGAAPVVKHTLTRADLESLLSEMESIPGPVQVSDVNYDTPSGIYSAISTQMREFPAAVDQSTRLDLEKIFGAHVPCDGDIGIWPLYLEDRLYTGPIKQSFVTFKASTYRIVAEADFTVQVGRVAYLATRHQSNTR